MAGFWAAAAEGAGGAIGTQAITEPLSQLSGNINSKLAYDRNRDAAAHSEAFQERMSNTAFTRMAADMKVAGLNPMLGFGAASSPAGATGSAQPVPGADFSSLFSNMQQGEQLAAIVRKINADTLKTIADTGEVKARTPGHLLDQKFTQAKLRLIDETTQSAWVDAQRKTKQLLAEDTIPQYRNLEALRRLVSPADAAAGAHFLFGE